MNSSDDDTLSRAFCTVSPEHATSTCTLYRLPAFLTSDVKSRAASATPPRRSRPRASAAAGRAVAGGAVGGGAVAGGAVAGGAEATGTGAGVAGSTLAASDGVGTGEGAVETGGAGVA